MSELKKQNQKASTTSRIYIKMHLSPSTKLWKKINELRINKKREFEQLGKDSIH